MRVYHRSWPIRQAEAPNSDVHAPLETVSLCALGKKSLSEGSKSHGPDCLFQTRLKVFLRSLKQLKGTVGGVQRNSSEE